jgi:hypothetical protein
MALSNPTTLSPDSAAQTLDPYSRIRSSSLKIQYPEPQTLDPKTLNPKPEMNPEPWTLNPEP